MTFAKQLLKHRESLGLSAAEMAKRLSLSIRVYYYYENGTRVPLEVAKEGIFARIERMQKR